jgi:hypothetical protein
MAMVRTKLAHLGHGRMDYSPVLIGRPTPWRADELRNWVLAGTHRHSRTDDGCRDCSTVVKTGIPMKWQL